MLLIYAIMRFIFVDLHRLYEIVFLTMCKEKSIVYLFSCKTLIGNQLFHYTAAQPSISRYCSNFPKTEPQQDFPPRNCIKRVFHSSTNPSQLKHSEKIQRILFRYIRKKPTTYLKRRLGLARKANPARGRRRGRSGRRRIFGQAAALCASAAPHGIAANSRARPLKLPGLASPSRYLAAASTCPSV